MPEVITLQFVWKYLSIGLDILIVAFIVYRLLVWIIATQAKHLLKGVFLVVLLYFLAEVLNLKTVTWLLEKFTPILAIALVVIFQPELRRFLEEIGANTFLNFSSKNSFNTTGIQHILKAVDLLQEKKLGGLIVIEQNSSLDPYVGSGVELNAALSVELLGSLFWRNSPTHDGAVIIRRNRLLAAGCLLPLSSSQSKTRWGTRHLAGLGLSEVSDAFVIIVSEETQEIAIAKHQQLFEKQSKEDVEAELFNVYKKGKMGV